VITAAEYNRYSKTAESAALYDRTSVNGHAGWGDQVGTIRQRVSDGCFEQATRNSSHTGFDVFGLLTVFVDTPGRPFLPRQMSDWQSCTPVSKSRQPGFGIT